MLAFFLARSADLAGEVGDWRAGDRRAVEGGMEEKWKRVEGVRGTKEAFSVLFL